MTNWTNFPIFLSVAKTGSLTAAARQLNISQPTAGRRLKSLEQSLGETLVTREKSGYVLTDFGKVVYAEIEKMQEMVRNIERLSVSQEDDIAGLIKFTGAEGILTQWLPKVLSGIRQEYPQLTFQIESGNMPLNLVQREADIGLRWFSPGHQNSLIARKVANVTLGLFASEEYIAARGMPSCARDIVSHEGVLYYTDMDQPAWMKDRDGRLSHVPRQISFRTNNLVAYQAAIFAGYGIGAMPLCMAYVHSQRLVRVFPKLSMQNGLWLISHSDLYRSRRIRTIFDYLVKAFKMDAAFFEQADLSVFHHASIDRYRY